MQEYAIVWPPRSRHHTLWKSAMYGIAFTVGRSSSKMREVRKKEKSLKPSTNVYGILLDGVPWLDAEEGQHGDSLLPGAFPWFISYMQVSLLAY